MSQKYLIRHKTGSYYIFCKNIEGWSEHFSEHSPLFSSVDELTDYVNQNKTLSDLAGLGLITYAPIDYKGDV